MAPPLGQKTVLAIDPGFRTGCKMVCLDRQGTLRHTETIFPHLGTGGTAKARGRRLSRCVSVFTLRRLRWAMGRPEGRPKRSSGH
ncbi:MAG: hypothetical protein R3B95_02960 [Nitrospirales bacterium]|nr:hypothetical protein [Nitrospirales bacterium]